MNKCWFPENHRVGILGEVHPFQPRMNVDNSKEARIDSPLQALLSFLQSIRLENIAER